MKASKHPASGGKAAGSSRTLLRLPNFHRDVREGNLDRPWSRNILVVAVLFVAVAPTHHTTFDERVDIGVVRVNLTSTDERVTVPCLAVASSGVSTTSSVGVGR